MARRSCRGGHAAGPDASGRKAQGREPDRRPDADRVLGPYDPAHRHLQHEPRGQRRVPVGEAADTNTAHATFTVRDTVNGSKMPIAPDHWAFGRCPTGQASLAPSGTDICYFDGFQNDKLYELIYLAKNPIVMGRGISKTTDFE